MLVSERPKSYLSPSKTRRSQRKWPYSDTARRPNKHLKQPPAHARARARLRGEAGNLGARLLQELFEASCHNLTACCFRGLWYGRGAEGRKTTPGMCTSQDPTVNPSSISFSPNADGGWAGGGQQGRPSMEEQEEEEQTKARDVGAFASSHTFNSSLVFSSPPSPSSRHCCCCCILRVSFLRRVPAIHLPSRLLLPPPRAPRRTCSPF